MTFVDGKDRLLDYWGWQPVEGEPFADLLDRDSVGHKPYRLFALARDHESAVLHLSFATEPGDIASHVCDKLALQRALLIVP